MTEIAVSFGTSSGTGVGVGGMRPIASETGSCAPWPECGNYLYLVESEDGDIVKIEARWFEYGPDVGVTGHPSIAEDDHLDDERDDEPVRGRF